MLTTFKKIEVHVIACLTYTRARHAIARAINTETDRYTETPNGKRSHVTYMRHKTRYPERPVIC